MSNSKNHFFFSNNDVSIERWEIIRNFKKINNQITMLSRLKAMNFEMEYGQGL